MQGREVAGMSKDSGTTLIADRQAGKSSKSTKLGRGSKIRKTGKTNTADRVVVIDAVSRLHRTEIAGIAAVVRETASLSQPTSSPRDVATTETETETGHAVVGVEAGDERLKRLLGPRPSKDRRLTNEVITTMRGFERRRQLLQDSLTATQVATALGVSRETVYGRAERGQLLAASEGGQLRFPRWQFDPTSDTGLLAGLPAVVKALGERPQFAKIAWLTSTRSSLGDTPLHLITTGKTEAVLGSAERFARGE